MRVVHVLGFGCEQCQETVKNARAAVQALSLEAEVIEVDSLPALGEFGALLTPVLVIDGTVKMAARVPSVEEIKRLLSE